MREVEVATHRGSPFFLFSPWTGNQGTTRRLQMATNAEGTNNEAVATGLVAGYVRTAGVR